MKNLIISIVTVLAILFPSLSYNQTTTDQTITEWMYAAKRGEAWAQYNVGMLYQVGSGVRQDYGEALRWHMLAADQGYAKAQSMIGYMYNMGQGVKQNDAEAMKWYLRAAEQGYAFAQLQVGSMYWAGKGVMIADYTEAVKWFRKAALQGNARGQFMMGVMYEKGEGVTQNKNVAKAWYKKSCENGYEEGCREYQRLK